MHPVPAHQLQAAHNGLNHLQLHQQHLPLQVQHQPRLQQGGVIAAQPKQPAARAASLPTGPGAATTYTAAASAPAGAGLPAAKRRRIFSRRALLEEAEMGGKNVSGNCGGAEEEEEEEEDEVLVRACGKEMPLQLWLQEQQELLDAAERQHRQ